MVGRAGGRKRTAHPMHHEKTGDDIRMAKEQALNALGKIGLENVEPYLPSVECGVYS